MQVTAVYGYVSALVAQVNYAGVSGIFGAYFKGLQGGIVGSV